MSEPLIAEAEASSELIDVFAETPWPSLLLSAGGQILALNRAICELLGIDQTAAIGKPVDLFVLDQERARVRALFKQAVSGDSSMSIRAHLRRPGRAPLTAELEAIAVSDDPAGRVTLVVHPCSLPDRRERLLLELNRLAPALLTAQSPEQVFSRAAQALVPLGIGMAVALFDPDRSMLRLTSATVNSAVTNFLIKAAGFRHTNMPIPLTTPGFSDALTERKAIFWTDPRAILQEIVPPPVVGICQRLLRIQGIRGFIFAPILAGEQVYGVLAVWSYPLSVDDVPFIEAFGYQIAAVLAQLDLRRQMETQIQRLDSLAATAQAVTTLGSLEDVLHVVCVQAQELLGAEHAGIFLPVEGDAATVCVMATGRGAPALVDMRMPHKESIVGQVFTSGRGKWIADVLEQQGIYQPAVRASPSRSALFQPLWHRGDILGVLVVNHSQPGRFSQGDLDYLARYAEYAAVAVANARLYREAEAIRSHLNTLIQHTPDVLLTIRQDSTIHVLNPDRLSAIAGYRPEQVEGRPVFDFIPQHLHEEALPRWVSIMDGQSQTFETEIVAANGAPLIVIVSAALIPDYGEVFLMVKDVTEQKRLEAQLHQNEKLAALGRLVAGAAHELNNPLAAILGLAQLQLLEELPPTMRADIENIERAALRASHIVRHLRTFAHPRPAEPQPLAIEALIAETLARLKTEFAAYTVEVTVDLARDLPPITADMHQIEQVLFNIMHNAVLALATNPPDAPRALTVLCREAGAVMRVAIGDSGPGIAPEHISHIFDPFFTTRGVGEGTGLGLSIVHAIVQQHGGRIWAESAPGKGTTFYVELPIAVPEVDSPPNVEAHAAPLPADVHILLVEDEDAVRTVTARALTRLGYTVDAVASGAEAFERALACDYALIISDLQMPGMDGPALYERLRRVRPMLRWLILTGDTMGEQSRKFLEQTALPVLPKPFSRDQLVARIAECIAAVP